MSKFDYCSFNGGYDDFAVSKEKYTKEQAMDIYKFENDIHEGNGMYLAICDAFVRHRAGMNEDNEPQVGWWLEYEEHKRSCPVWAFHLSKTVNEKFKEYEHIEF